MRRLNAFGLIAALGLGLAGCAHQPKPMVGGDASMTYSRIYLCDFDTAWQSVLEALKRNRLDVLNREGGFIQTRWTDNTEERNLADSNDATDAYLKAQYRFRVTAAKGFYNGRPSVKVTVQREQLVQKDVLDGWRALESDSIEENTLLYRIGRLILMKTRQSKVEEERIQLEMGEGGTTPRSSFEQDPSLDSDNDLDSTEPRQNNSVDPGRGGNALDNALDELN